MGASKTKHYSEYEKNIAKIGRALSHPARVRILDILLNKEWCISQDLIKDLRLSQSSVHNHIQKLKEADFVKVDFLPTCYTISLNPNTISTLQDWSDSHA